MNGSIDFRNLLASGAALAPMAGFTDASMRGLCAAAGAAFTVSEMISAKAVRLGDKKSLELMKRSPEEDVYGIQLFGSDPEDFAYTAKLVREQYAPDFIDINMGCPAPKITGSGAGSRLMTAPSLAADIVAAAAEASGLPVTVKMRAGYDRVTAPELAPLLEQAGASCLFVHARTRDQGYRPPIFPEVIRAVADSVSIPVAGNGDILRPADAVRMRETTGCAGVMIGRGALGDPSLFTRVAALQAGKQPLPPPTLEWKLEMLKEQARRTALDKGEYIGIREMRKHAPYFFRGVNGAAALRAKAVQMETLADVEELCRLALEAGPAREQDFTLYPGGDL